MAVSAEALKQAAEKANYWFEYASRLEHELGEALHRAKCPHCGVVGGAGIEPATSCMSSKRSTTELTARDKSEYRFPSFTLALNNIPEGVSVMSTKGSDEK